MAEAQCKVCSHTEREEIDRRLAGGMTNVAASQKWGMGRDSVRRHRVNHLSASLHTLSGIVSDPKSTSALDRAENLFRRAESLLTAAEENGSSTAVVAAMKETRAAIELLAKLTGELDTSTNINVLNLSTSQEWLNTRTAMFQALQPYPEARIAVAKAVQAVES